MPSKLFENNELFRFQMLFYEITYQRFILLFLLIFNLFLVFIQQNKRPFFNFETSDINKNNIFLEPYLLPKEKRMFYKYLDSSSIYFEFGSGGFTHQAAKRGLKIFSVEISDSWHFLLKKEFEQIEIKQKSENKSEYRIDITYIVFDIQTNSKETNQRERQKFVKVYNHSKYKADFIVINSLYPLSCLMNIYNEIDTKPFIFLHGVDKKRNCSFIEKYYEIVEKADKSFVLRKKNQSTLLTKEYLQKVENEDFHFKNKKNLKVSLLFKNFYDIYEKYKYTNTFSNKPKTNNVWIFWYQGFDNLPSIVEICINSVKQNFHNGNINFIDKTNYFKYANIPKYIIDKFEAKKMSITAFSDILRSAILATNGGLWLDATIFVSREIPSYIFNLPYFTIHCDNDFGNILGKWTGFLQSSYSNGIVPKFCMDVIFAYWEKFDYRIDYLLLDIIMLFGYNYIPSFRRIIEGVPLSNDVYDLINVANKIYTEKMFDDVMKKNNFFKMSWKKEFTNQINGKKTIFGYLEEKFLKE